MIAAACVVLALQWAPPSHELPRQRVCSSILAATADDLEQRWLLVVAAEESEFRPRVLDCRERGDQGRALGAWQVHARSAREANVLCAGGVGAALAALERIRESARRCGKLRIAHRHTSYAAGSCSSRAGRRISERRHGKVVASLVDGS